MNRRRVMAAGILLLVGVGAIAGPRLLTPNRNEGKVTLRSRIMAYENGPNGNNPNEVVESDIAVLMGEYFKIGMSYEEAIKLLEENDLKVDEIYTNAPDYRIKDKIVYFSPAIVSVIQLPTWYPLLSFSYRLSLRFHNSKLDQFSASRIGSGP